MSDDSDVDRSTNPRPENESRGAARSPESAGADASTATDVDGGAVFSREDWEAVPSDPDLREDLGYAISSWERINTKDGSEQVMFLPDDEDALRDEAFVVATTDSLAELSEEC